MSDVEEKEPENTSDDNLDLAEESPAADQSPEPAVAADAAPAAVSSQTAPAVSTIPPPVLQKLTITPGEPEGDAKPSPAETSTPDTNTVTVPGYRPPAEDALQRKLNDIATVDDLANGHITPKTYSDLFANKGTLGKIGTFFGLMLSGAGSGLAHQPNALMDMMNKELDRDLDAQKTYQTNRQNWYKIAMEQEQNVAQQQLTSAQTVASRMGTYGQGLQNDLAAYSLSKLPGAVDMTASTYAKNGMLAAAVQEQQNIVNKMAPGPAKTIAQTQIDTKLRPAMYKQMSDNQDQLAQKKSMLHAMSPNPIAKALTPPTDPRGPVVNDGIYQSGIQLGRLAPHIPGAIPEGQVPAINNEANILKANRNNYADWLDSFNKLQNMKFAGQVPAAGAAKSFVTGASATAGGVLGGLFGAGIGGALGNTLGHAGTELQNVFERERNIQVEALKQRLGSNMSEEDKNKMVNALLPAWNDSEDSSKEAFRKGTQHFKSLENNTQNLDQYGLKTPFPEMPYQMSEKTKKSKKNDNEKIEEEEREMRNSQSKMPW